MFIWINFFSLLLSWFVVAFFLLPGVSGEKKKITDFHQGWKSTTFFSRFKSWVNLVTHALVVLVTCVRNVIVYVRRVKLLLLLLQLTYFMPDARWQSYKHICVIPSFFSFSFYYFMHEQVEMRMHSVARSKI